MDYLATIQLVFAEEGEGIVASELGEFLGTFATIYEAASMAVADEPMESVLFHQARFLDRTRATLADIVRSPLPRRAVRSGTPLTCTKISYASPLEIWFAGVATALALAVILAGGEISLFGVKVKLKKSLGESLKDLRAVIGQAASPGTGHAAKPVRATKPAQRNPAQRKPALKKTRSDLPPPPVSVATERDLTPMKTVSFRKLPEKGG